MANLNKINKDYEEILLGLSFEEIVAYYRNINKKMLETYPSLDSHKWNIEKHNKLFYSVEEATDVFKTKYPLINVIKYGTKFEELETKYLKELDLATYKLLASGIITLTTSIKFLIKDILSDFSHIYLYYEYATSIGTSILKEELNVPEELLEPLEPYFYNRNNSSFYGAKAISYLNENIEINFQVLEVYLKAFNDNYRRLEFNAEEFTEETVEFIELYNKHYDSGVKAIEELEGIKEEPFRTAIEISVEVMKKHEEESVLKHNFEKILEHKLASAPKYNFETFELILPTEGVDPEGSVKHG